MAKITQEKIAMMKSIKEVDNFFELIAFLYTWRRRELWQGICVVSIAINIGLIIKYTPIIDFIIRKLFK